ncbi:MAG: protein of unassigned function, partial [Methylobacterium brachiatum]|nr:protein of unassigned function [Methylobacterium brachiatum]
PDRIVFSCMTADGILYQKTIRSGRGTDTAFVSLRIRYPASEKARWQAAVVTASNTFRILASARER